MLPLPWPDINYFISSDNELLFTLRKLARGNYGILKMNSEEDPLLYIFRLCRRDWPAVHGISLLWNVGRPRVHRLLLTTVLLFLQHLCQWTDHLPHIAVPVACVYSSSSACPASTAPASSSSLRSANLTDWGRLWPNTLPHLSLSSVTHLALSAAFTGLLRLTASPPVTCELPPNASISNYKSHFMIIFHCWTFLINKSYDNDNVYLWISLTESLLVMSPEAENILEELSWLPSRYFPVLL